MRAVRALLRGPCPGRRGARPRRLARPSRLALALRRGRGAPGTTRPRGWEPGSEGTAGRRPRVHGTTPWHRHLRPVGQTRRRPWTPRAHGPRPARIREGTRARATWQRASRAGGRAGRTATNRGAAPRRIRRPLGRCPALGSGASERRLPGRPRRTRSRAGDGRGRSRISDLRVLTLGGALGGPRQGASIVARQRLAHPTFVLAVLLRGGVDGLISARMGMHPTMIGLSSPAYVRGRPKLGRSSLRTAHPAASGLACCLDQGRRDRSERVPRAG
ncbi:hypothetical protein BH23CHL8_BH23CHL8_31740 [soil metagenome]